MALLLPLLRGAPPVVAAPPPNIVFILTDDQRWDTIDATHSLDGQTPVMQKVTQLLVNKGVLFQNHFVTTALCAPSRSSILSGKYAHTTGVHSKRRLRWRCAPTHTWKYVELQTNEKELYNEDRAPSELGNVSGASTNASLIAIMANRLRELDPGWPGTATATAPGSAADENTDDDPE